MSSDPDRGAPRSRLEALIETVLTIIDKEGLPSVAEVLILCRAELFSLTRQQARLREFVWINHGCSFNHLYGDDGELQCSHLVAHPGVFDFKRTDMDVILDALKAGRVNALAERAALAPEEPPRMSVQAAYALGLVTLPLALVVWGKCSQMYYGWRSRREHYVRCSACGTYRLKSKSPEEPT